MTNEYKVHQSADDRKEAATMRIKEKIAVLELWERDGVPENYEWFESVNHNKKHGCPTNQSQFVKWNDANLKIEVRMEGKKHSVKGVYSFSAPTLDHKDRSGLKDRAQELLISIKNHPEPKNELRKVKAELKAERAFRQQLVNKNAMLNHEIQTLKEDMDMVSSTNKNLLDRVRELDAELIRTRQIRGLHPVK